MDKGVHKLFMQFVNGKDLEEWYYSLKRAASLTENVCCCITPLYREISYVVVLTFILRATLTA